MKYTFLILNKNKLIKSTIVHVRYQSWAGEGRRKGGGGSGHKMIGGFYEDHLFYYMISFGSHLSST